MSLKPKAILFDLDGTIMDTNELIIQSFLYALKGIVPSEFNREHIIPSMGLPLSIQLQQFSGREQVEDLIAAYREVNLRLHDEYVKAFPNVNEVMAGIHAAGIKIGIVTTKIRLTTEKGLRYAGLYDYVEPGAIVTIEDVTRPKPDAEPVRLALEKLGIEPGAAMMVGDSIVDIQSAEAAGVISVGVAWSLKGEKVLKESGARHIIHDMRDLYALAGLE
ncbi:HAD-IA family hydrolase [Paenibacillus sacheonensis]|uniref:HAD-IA family hydrolase n=1 Tax=Paenibacillus sacheonensis TaxID=742054 RepID=A0A7X4YVS3_9BACL|nr:HAD-IA family hydrolase [Paenibacillus sacheonensis]MBM7567003.1 pyrophosphatase PpaX [Paenibacillus sacheonensis]NBC73422.1 HAD-IA family hydrolase [Paenibacillus sacheonensis]